MLSVESIVAPGDEEHTPLPKMVTEGHVDGLVVYVHITERLAGELDRLNVPFVVMDGEALEGVPTVNVWEEETTALAVRHLVELGHERIAFISGPISVTYFRVIDRRMGYLRELASSELTPVPGWDSVDSEEELFRSLLASGGPPTAVIVWDDVAAGKCMRVADCLGVRIPEDVSMVSCHPRFFGRFFPKDLTRVERPLAEMARIATDMLTKRMSGEPVSPLAETLAPVLIAGATTGPAERG